MTEVCLLWSRVRWSLSSQLMARGVMVRTIHHADHVTPGARKIDLRRCVQEGREYTGEGIHVLTASILTFTLVRPFPVIS